MNITDVGPPDMPAGNQTATIIDTTADTGTGTPGTQSNAFNQIGRIYGTVVADRPMTLFYDTRARGADWRNEQSFDVLGDGVTMTTYEILTNAYDWRLYLTAGGEAPIAIFEVKTRMSPDRASSV